MRKLTLILTFLPLFGIGQHHMMSVLASQSAPVDVTSNVLFVWELNETTGSTMEDATTNNIDGIKSGALINQTGKIGAAYFFDGLNDYGYTSSFPGPVTSATISIWINPSAGNADYDRVLGFQGYDLDLAIGSGNDLQVFDGSWNENLYTVSAGTWYHVVLTMNSSTGWKLYVNGVEEHSDPTTRTLAGYFNIGFSLSDALSGGNYGTGTFDQVAAWERVLSQDDITFLYNSGNGRAYTSW